MFFSTSPIKLLKKIRAVTLTLSIVGIVLSAYSVYVHQRKEANKEYKAFCDISDEVSCSKVFTSKWGKGFGVLGSYFGEDSPLVLSNGIYGIALYLIVIALGEIQSVAAATIQKYLVLLTNLMSVYLGYILLFILKDKCVVCISIYAINLLITIMCFFRVRYVVALKSKKKANKTSTNQNSKNVGKKNQNETKSNQTTGSKNQNTNKNNQNVNKNQNTGKSNNQNANKGNQNANKSNQNASKSNQTPSNKKKEKGQKQNSEQVANHDAVSAKKNEQQKNASNVKHRQPQQQQTSKKNNQNAVLQNVTNKQSSNKSNANQSKHSKKKNN